MGNLFSKVLLVPGDVSLPKTRSCESVRKIYKKKRKEHEKFDAFGGGRGETQNRLIKPANA